MSSWCVVATVRAPKGHLEKFVAHYAAAGAVHIFLFHDDPDQAEPLEHPLVKNTVCDAAYWKSGRPDEIEARQRRNAGRAKKWSKAEWILHCDHDELLTAPRPLSAILAGMADNVHSVLAPPAEAIYETEPDAGSCFDTPWFKTPMQFEPGLHPAVRAALGPAADLTRGGLTGHLRGKSLTRIALQEGRLPIHLYKDVPEGLVGNVTVPGLYILHFDALTFEDWVGKHLRRIDGMTRLAAPSDLHRRQWEAISRARDQGGAALHRLYLQLNVIGAGRMAAAERAGFVQRIDRSLGYVPGGVRPRAPGSPGTNPLAPGD